METKENKPYVFVNSYPELICLMNNQEQIFSTYLGSYQGEYVVVSKDDKNVFVYQDYYGSCSGCDWLEGLYCYGKDDIDNPEDKSYAISYKEANDYVQNIKHNVKIPIKVYNSLSELQKIDLIGSGLSSYYLSELTDSCKGNV